MNEYVFCPRCGAVTKPGVCTNCGYTINKEEQSAENVIDSNYEKTQQTFYTGPEKKKSEPNTNKSSKGWIIGLIIGAVVVLATIILIVVLALFAFLPIVIKGVYNTSQITTNTSTTNNTNNNNNSNPNLFPEIGPDEDPDDDSDVNPDADPDDPDLDLDVNDPNDNEFYYYSTTIEGLYSGTSKFDYDDFINNIVPSANEYWDEPAEDNFDYFINGNYSSYLRSEVSHNFIERDGFATPYYEYLVDSYIENKNYTVERRAIRYEGECDGIFINAYCTYYALSSDKVDFTKANEALRNQAISELYEFVSKNKNTNSDETFNYTLYTDSVVTFNNDEVISIGFSTTSYVNNYIENFYIHGINVDVKKGGVLDNTAILDFRGDFAEFFVERSNIQNSYVDAINYSPFEDTAKLFQDDDALIMLFTPLGIEVGINYRYHDSYGWVTVTLNDFDDYFMHQYSFDTDWGHGYDIYQYEKDNNIYFDPFANDDQEEYFYDL